MFEKHQVSELEDIIKFDELEEIIEEDLEVIVDDEVFIETQCTFVEKETPLKMIGALDYVKSITPVIKDDGAEFTIKGFGSIHKRNPEWKTLMEYIKIHSFYVADRRTGFIMRHDDYETGESWWNLGVRGYNYINKSPKEFNKKSLKRFLELIKDQWGSAYTPTQLQFFNEALLYKEYSLEELDELSELMERFHCIELCDKIFSFRTLTLDGCEDLIRRGVLSPETFFTKNEHDMMVEIESNITKMECLRFDKETTIPYSLNDEFGEFIISSPQKYEDLWVEGNALHHCVGGYSKQVYKGNSQIYFIRSKSSPNTPLYTMEVCDGKINQLFGAWNKSPKVEIENTILDWCSDEYGWTPSHTRDQYFGIDDFDIDVEDVLEIIDEIEREDFIDNL